MSFFKKAIFAALLIGCLGFSSAALAEDTIQIIIDDKVLSTDVPPMIIEGRTLVPLRAIFEALGAVVGWDEATQTVTATKQGTTIVLTIDQKQATVNGATQELDVPATVINDRTMVPVRFIANSLGSYVEWVDSTQTVIILTPKTIVFKDKNLEKGIREKIGKASGEIKNTDVRNITELKVPGVGIESLDGIENLQGLTKLDISGNKIATLSPIKSLIKLTELSASSNKITEISPLKELKSLTSIRLSANQIGNIDVLSTLPTIKELYLQFNPLDGLNALTSLGEGAKVYILDSKNPLAKLDATTLLECDQVLKKATEITKKLIKSGMSDFEKEIILHDYLVMHTQYDSVSLVNLISSDYCHSAYGALVLGKAVCDGYAKALEIMLNMVGVECTMVTGISYNYEGRPIGHAWNIVKIDGKYYHLDATGNDLDGKKGEISHKYFNLSDKQISFGRVFVGADLPKCVTDNADFNDMLKINKWIIYTDNDIYSVSSDNLFKINPKTGIAEKLITDKVAEIQMVGDWIYYINSSDLERIYKVKTDGTGKMKVSDESAISIQLTKKNLYYISKDNKLNKISLDDKTQTVQSIFTGDYTTCIFAVDQWIYYRMFSWSVRGKIERLSDDSNASETIVNETPAGFKEREDVSKKYLSISYGNFERVAGGYLYYISLDEQNKLYRVKLDGTDRTQISSDSIDSLIFDIIGDYVYYQSSSDGNKTYRAKADGSGRICIS